MRAFRAALLALLAILLAFPASATRPGEPDAAGTIAIGLGDLRLARGVDHFLVGANSDDVIGFSYTGDIRYETTYFSWGDGLYHHVSILAPLGARDVAFTFTWAKQGDDPMVPLPEGWSRPTNCHDEHCLT